MSVTQILIVSNGKFNLISFKISILPKKNHTFSLTFQSSSQRFGKHHSIFVCRSFLCINRSTSSYSFIVIQSCSHLPNRPHNCLFDNCDSTTSPSNCLGHSLRYHILHGPFSFTLHQQIIPDNLFLKHTNVAFKVLLDQKNKITCKKN